MAINGIEAGAFAGSPLGDISFQESPNHARDSGPQIFIGTSFQLIAEQNSANITASGDNSSSGGLSGDGNNLANDGSHCVFSIGGIGPTDQYGANALPAVWTPMNLGAGWQLFNYKDFWGVNYLGEPDDYPPAPMGFYVGDLNNDTSFAIRTSICYAAGIYSGNCGFSYSSAGIGQIAGEGENVPPGTQVLPLQLNGKCTFQIISADFQQTIDVTPLNCGTTAQGLVAVTFNTKTLFGRTIGFYAQVKMTSIGNPWLVSDPWYNHSFVFGPTFNCNKTG